MNNWVLKNVSSTAKRILFNLLLFKLSIPVLILTLPIVELVPRSSSSSSNLQLTLSSLYYSLSLLYLSAVWPDNTEPVLNCPCNQGLQSHTGLNSLHRHPGPPPCCYDWWLGSFLSLWILDFWLGLDHFFPDHWSFNLYLTHACVGINNHGIILVIFI